MSSPEASIEEILASIRKTFADEPEAQGAQPALSMAEQRTVGMPPFRSAADTSNGATPLPTPPRSRVAAIDDDLEDFIEKPAATTSAAPKLAEPAFAPQPAPAPQGPAMSPVEAAREKWANLLNPHPLTNGAATSVADAKPISAAPAQAVPHAPAASPAPTGLFAPRKGGFYPPQDARPDPVLPMPAAAPAAAPVAAPATQFGSAPAQSLPEAAPVHTPTAPRPGFIPFPQTAPPAPEPVAAAPVQAPAPVSDVSAASARALDDLVAGLNNPAPAPSEPAPLAKPEPAATVAPVTVPAPAPLAAVAAVAPVSPAPVTPAQSAPESAPPSSASRSFEDVVADMLRPLLEKWIDENMPRIVERALQRDAALGRKPGS